MNYYESYHKYQHAKNASSQTYSSQCTFCMNLVPTTTWLISTNYNETLQVTEQHQYLGLIFHESMQWSHHIQAMCIKANRSLNFLRRNLSKCSSNVKQNAYITIIRPLLEYAACVWDPYHEYLIYDIEKIQRHAARWVLSDFGWYST